MRLIALTTTILGSITFLSVAWPYLLPIIQNRNVWAAISLIAILLFTSGHMFNHIRKVPYVAGDGRGGISYFAGGFSSQFGLETQIVAAMCKSTWTLDAQNDYALTEYRWSTFFRYHLISAESTTNIGPKDSAARRYCVGRCHLRHVQLFAQRFPDQEWWLSILVTSFLMKYLINAVL